VNIIAVLGQKWSCIKQG